MPAGNHRGGAVARHDRRDGDDEHRGEAGEQDIHRLVVAPLARGAEPSQRGDAVAELADLGRGTVAEDGEIGNHPGKPEERGDRQIAGHRKDVPEQGAREVGPHAVVVGNRKEEPDEPDAADVDRRIDTCADDCKNGHRLGRTGNGEAPFLAGQEEDRRDERSRVGHRYPEDEVGDPERVAVVEHLRWAGDCAHVGRQGLVGG